MNRPYDTAARSAPGSPRETSVKLQPGPPSASGPSVEYIRVPGPDGVDPIFSISRDTMMDLVLPRVCNGFKPPVRSLLIKKPGAKRGIRYVNVASLRAYMANLESQAS